MTEPASAAAAGFAAAKSGVLGSLMAKVASLAAVGALGAFIIALADPLPDNTPRATRLRVLAAQVLVASVFSLAFTMPALRYLDHTFAWITLPPKGAGVDLETWTEWVLPVGLLVGCMAWGAVGALIKLRDLIRDRFPNWFAAKVMPPNPEVKP